MRALTAPMSVFPAAFAFTTPITLPMSLTDAAPVDAMASWMRASTSASVSCAGRYTTSSSISACSLAARSGRLPCSNWAIDSLRCLSIFSTTARTWASSSSTRSSTSRCLIAACSMRIVPRRSFSPARIADFMSSVIRSLREAVVIVMVLGRARSTAAALTLAVERAAGSEIADARGRSEVAGAALLVALHGGRLLALTLLRRLLVEFAATKFRQHAGLFTRTLEAAQGGIEILVFTDADAGHRNLGQYNWPAGGLGASHRNVVGRQPTGPR